MIDFGSAYTLAMLAILGIGFFAALVVPLTSVVQVAEVTAAPSETVVEIDDNGRKARMSKACAQRRILRRAKRGYA